MKLILASQSPRRRELMAMVAPKFSVRVSQADETLPPDTPPEKAVELLSLRKALAVQASIEEGEREETVIVGCDTVVAIDGRALKRSHIWKDHVIAGSDTVAASNEKVLGKPHSREECLEMMAALSGREHTVHTGVALLCGKRQRVFRETARVAFWPLSQAVIDWYAATDEPYDKAGGYGVQGLGALLVQGIRGDYYTVMGLPVSRLWRELREFVPGMLPLMGPGAEN